MPFVADKPASRFVPDVAATPPASSVSPGLAHAADAAGVFLKHPFTAGIGMSENVLSSVTGGAGSLADAMTFSDPGAHDWAYRPRTEAGSEIARLSNVEATKAGQKYDKYAGTGPLATTIKERGQEAMGAVGTITALSGLRGAVGAGRVPVNARPGPTSVLRSDVPGEAGAAAVPETAAVAERPAGLAKVSEATPSKAALKEASQAAYKRAEDAGAVISKDSFAKAQEVTASLLEKEGIDPTLHPSTTAALKRFGAEKGPITLEKLETLRRIAKDAESTQVPADRRLAGKLVDTIDNFAETLGQKDFIAGSPEAIAALKEARNLWSRSRKAETLDELVSRAELSAPNFSASGMENALRTEFRNLAKNQARMRVFTAEEQAAIRKVAKGGATENALRMLGKFAPTGAISTAISGTAGFMAGGPVGAMALPAVGGAARYAATRMTMRNVTRANELVRRGPNALANKRTGNALKRSTEEVQP
jgi:hypothetical protein